MSIQTRVTVGTTPTLVATNTHAIARARVRMKNIGTAIIAIGGSDVTAANGFEVAISGEESFDLDPGQSLYGIVAAATQVMEVLVL